MSFEHYGDESFFVPASNGLVFLGSVDSGVAIIKNCSARHVALEFGKNRVGYREQCQEGHTVKDVRYQFIVMEGTLADAIELANFVNVAPVWSANVTAL